MFWHVFSNRANGFLVVLAYRNLVVNLYWLLCCRACIDAYLCCWVAWITVGSILIWHVHLPNLHVQNCQKHQLCCLAQIYVNIQWKSLSIICVCKLLCWRQDSFLYLYNRYCVFICWYDPLGCSFLKGKPKSETP